MLFRSVCVSVCVCVCVSVCLCVSVSAVFIILVSFAQFGVVLFILVWLVSQRFFDCLLREIQLFRDSANGIALFLRRFLVSRILRHLFVFVASFFS